MNTVRRKKMLSIIVFMLVLTTAVGLLLFALGQNISLFYTPAQLSTHPVASHTQLIRLGGLVRAGSIVHGEQLSVRFDVTDGQYTIPVLYHGVLPDLFREGKSMVAEGVWTGQEFNAQRVLAKHDENYMPAEVSAALRNPA